MTRHLHATNRPAPSCDWHKQVTTWISVIDGLQGRGQVGRSWYETAALMRAWHRRPGSLRLARQIVLTRAAVAPDPVPHPRSGAHARHVGGVAMIPSHFRQAARPADFSAPGRCGPGAGMADVPRHPGVPWRRDQLPRPSQPAREFCDE